MSLKMVHHLFQICFITLPIPTSITSSYIRTKCSTKLWTTHRSYFSLLWFHRAQSLKFDASRKWLPFEVKHWVMRWNFNPPIPPLQGFSYKTRIITRSDNELVTVLNIGIWERNLGLLFSGLFCTKFGGCCGQLSKVVGVYGFFRTKKGRRVYLVIK